MAVVGSAHIVVKAITTGFQKDVRQALRDMRPALESEGQQSAKSFTKGFKDQSKTSLESFNPLRGTKGNFEAAGESSAKAFSQGLKRQSKESLSNFNPFAGKQKDFREAGGKAGTAFGSGLKKEIRTQLGDLDSTFDRGGKRAGKAFSESFKTNMRDSLANFDPTRGTKSTYSEAGRRASAAFTADFKRDIKLALKDLEDDFYKSGSKAGKRFQQGFRDETRSFKKYFSGLFDRDGGEGGIGRFISSLTGKFGNFRQAALQANDAFFRLVTTGYFIGPLVGQLISSLSALVSGFVALASAVGSAVPALIVLPGIFAAIGQAALTLKLAFGGIGEAIKEYSKTSGGGVDNAKRIEQAERRLAQVLEANREALARADKNLERAERDLTEARLEAAESLQQLNFDAEDAALSEQRAAIQLEKAREALARVQDLPPNSRARREAELAYAEADLNLRRAKDRNADLAKETEEANQKGVEGSDQVVAATERLQEAIDDKARAERDAIRSQIDAEEALEEAKKGSGGAGGSTALDKLSEEAKEFAKFIVDVVKPAVEDLKKAAGEELFGPLQIALQDLVDNLFPRLEGILRKTGGAIGVAAIELASFITSADNLDRLDKLGDTNVYVIERLGTVFGNLYESMLILLNAADPLIRRFTDWIVTITTGWTETLRAKEETGELTEMFNQAGDVAAQLGDIFGNLWGALMNIGKAAAGPGSGGQALLDMLQNSTQRFEDFTAEISENGKLEKYFNDVASNVGEIGRAIVDITKAFLSLADNPSIGKFWGQFADSNVSEFGADIIDTLTEASTFLIPFGEQLVLLIKNFTESKSIEIFFGILTDALKVINGFLSQDWVQKIVLQTAAFMGGVKALTLLSKIGGFIGKVIAGYFFKFAGVLGKLAGVISKIGMIATGKVGLGAFLAGGAIVVGIAAVIALFVGLWKNSEKFREAVSKLGAVIKDTLIVAFDRIKEAIDKALEPIGGMKGGMEGLSTILQQIGDFLADHIIPIIQGALVFSIEAATEVISLFIGVVSGIIQVFQGVWEFVQGIFALFRGDVDGMSEHFGAAWERIKSAFVTVFQFVLDFFAGIIEAIIGFLTPWEVDIGAIFSRIGDFISTVWDVIKIAFDIVWSAIKTAISVGSAVITTTFETLKTAVSAVWDGIKIAFETAWDFITSTISGIGSIFSTAFGVVASVVETVINGIGTAFSAIGSFVANIAGGVTSAFKTAFNFVADIWNSTAGKLSFSIPDWVPLIGGKSFSVRNMPKFNGDSSVSSTTAEFARQSISLPVFSAAPVTALAEGGIVPAVRGGMLAVIGEAGKAERVEPLDDNGLSKRDRALIQMLSGDSGGTVINVYPSKGMDESELAAAVSRELAFQLRRGAMR